MIAIPPKRPFFRPRTALVAAIVVAFAGCAIPAKVQHPALRDEVPLAAPALLSCRTQPVSVSSS